MGHDLILVKHEPRFSREDRKRNQRFQRNLLELIDSAHKAPADATENEQNGVTANERLPQLEKETIPEASHDQPGDQATRIINISSGDMDRVEETPPAEESIQKPPEVAKQKRLQLRKFKVYFLQEEWQLIEKISAARGQRPDDLVRFATLKFFADLGIVDDARKQMILLFS